MASPHVMRGQEDLLLHLPPVDPQSGENVSCGGLSVEKKLEYLESLAGPVSNRRARRWLNDRLLMELVPRLNAEEIRGLFAPPPWGDDVPPSPFSRTNVEEWDRFRNIDMDKEAKIIGSMKGSSKKRRGHVDSEKMAVLNAWRRINCRTREALRHSFLPELVEGYEVCIRDFLMDGGEEDVLQLRVQDPFHRLLLHGVCEFYNLASVTVTESKNAKLLKITKITKKKSGPIELPNITLSHFLRMTKEGTW